MPVACALPAARPLRRLCLLCLLPLASGLLDLYDDTFEEIIQEEPVLLVLFYDPRSTQFEAFEPVYEAAAAELGDEVPLARISANLEPRATARYAAVELPRLVVFRQGRDYRFRRGPGLPTQEELVIYMRQEAKLAQTAMPSTMQLAWHGLADEISRLDREATSSITIIDTLGLDSTGRLLKLSERPDRRRPGSEEYHDRNWVAASLPLLGALTEEVPPSPRPSLGLSPRLSLSLSLGLGLGLGLTGPPPTKRSPHPAPLTPPYTITRTRIRHPHLYPHPHPRPLSHPHPQPHPHPHPHPHLHSHPHLHRSRHPHRHRHQALREKHLAHFVGAPQYVKMLTYPNPNPNPSPTPTPNQVRHSTSRCSLRPSYAYRPTASSPSTCSTSASKP